MNNEKPSTSLFGTPLPKSPVKLTGSFQSPSQKIPQHSFGKPSSPSSPSILDTPKSSSSNSDSNSDQFVPHKKPLSFNPSPKFPSPPKYTSTASLSFKPISLPSPLPDFTKPQLLILADHLKASFLQNTNKAQQLLSSLSQKEQVYLRKIQEINRELEMKEKVERLMERSEELVAELEAKIERCEKGREEGTGWDLREGLELVREIELGIKQLEEVEGEGERKGEESAKKMTQVQWKINKVEQMVKSL